LTPDQRISVTLLSDLIAGIGIEARIEAFPTLLLISAPTHGGIDGLVALQNGLRFRDTAFVNIEPNVPIRNQLFTYSLSVI
jgi:hypothetical protein